MPAEAKSKPSQATNWSAASLGDLALSFVLFGICGGVLNAAFKMAPSRYEPLGPAFFPKAIAGIIAILAAIILIKTLVAQRNQAAVETTAPAEFDHTPFMSLMVFAATCAFVALIGTGWVHFGVLSFVFVAGVALFLSSAVRVNRVLLIAVALVISASTYLLFTQLFSVAFPS